MADDSADTNLTPDHTYRERVPNPDLLLSRVLTNDSEIRALREHVAETRVSDRRLVEQRSDSLAGQLDKAAQAAREMVEERSEALAAELTKTAEHLLTLSKEERAADQREYRILTSSLEDRRVAATNTLEQKVQDWRYSDREARELQATEYARRLDVLNHAHERTQEVLNNSVTREVFQVEREALHASIVQLDRTLLGMTPLSVSDRAHADMQVRTEAALASASKVLDTKIEVAQRQIAELKEYVDKTSGGKTAQSAMIAYAVTTITVLISVIVFANSFLGQ